jgi:hypothetical protein
MAALRLAERSTLIAPSATLAMAAEARRLKSEGIEVYDFSLGEPDFDTPVNVQEAAFRAIRGGYTHYTPPAGLPELRQTIARHYTEHERLATTPDQVVVSNGAKHAIHNALMAVCQPGDEVLIPSPYWVSYADLVKLTGASPVILETSEQDGFKLRPDQLRKAITPRSVQAPPGSAPESHHPPEPAAHDQQPKQSDGCGLQAIGVGRTRWRSARIGYRRAFGRDLRATLLRRSPAHVLRVTSSRLAGPHHHNFRSEQDLRHDRLADRVVRRTGARFEVHGRPPEPGDEQPVLS